MRGGEVSFTFGFGFGFATVVVGLLAVVVGVAPTRLSAWPDNAQASPLQPVFDSDVVEALTVTVIGPPSNTNSHFAPGASGFIGTQTFSQRTWYDEPPAGVYCSRSVPAWIVQTLLIVQVSPAVTVMPPARLPVTCRRCVPRYAPSIGDAAPSARGTAPSPSSRPAAPAAARAIERR